MQKAMKKVDLISAAKALKESRKLRFPEVPLEQRLELAEAVLREEITNGQAVRALANAMGCLRSNAQTALTHAVWLALRSGERKLVKP